jgi:hypothetical protein
MFSKPKRSVLTETFDKKPQETVSPQPAVNQPEQAHPHVQPHVQPQPQDSGDAMNRLLRHELTAIETYQCVIDTFDGQLATQLKPLLEGHQRRAAYINDYLLALGKKRNHKVGFWGVLMSMTDSSGTLLDLQTVLAALSEMEGHGVSDYRRELCHLDDLTRVQVEAELLPGQERAVAALATAKSAATDDQPPGPQS